MKPTPVTVLSAFIACATSLFAGFAQAPEEEPRSLTVPETFIEENRLQYPYMNTVTFTDFGDGYYYGQSITTKFETGEHTEDWSPPQTIYYEDDRAMTREEVLAVEGKVFTYVREWDQREPVLGGWVRSVKTYDLVGWTYPEGNQKPAVMARTPMCRVDTANEKFAGRLDEECIRGGQGKYKQGIMLNMSVMVDLKEGETVTPGFVLTRGAMLLIRVIGPALKDFGITDYVEEFAQPGLIIYHDDSIFHFGSPLWKGGFYNMYAGIEAAERTGAFPFFYMTENIVSCFYSPPGVYTFKVIPKEGHSGKVLIEVYEVPFD